jgi:hypothetical protein
LCKIISDLREDVASKVEAGSQKHQDAVCSAQIELAKKVGLASSGLTPKAFSFAQIQVPQITEKSPVMENTVWKALKSFFVWGEKQNTESRFSPPLQHSVFCHEI